MSDDMIVIPSFLSGSLGAVKASGCSWCSEYSCETDSMGSCGAGCQTTCEGTCQTACQSSCQTGCQANCQSSCETGCLGCQTSSQCYEVCTDACERSCQSCESCQDSCQHSCQSMQGGSGPCSECDDCMGSNQGTAPYTSGSILSYSVTSTSITIHFLVIAYASSYQISYRKLSDSNVNYLTTSSSTYTIRGLDPGTEYVINYRGLSEFGNGPFMASGEKIKTAFSKSHICMEDGNWKNVTPYIYNSGWKKTSDQIL